ncbi:peptide chain release factor H, partial [Oleiphilus sp. HI0061]
MILLQLSSGQGPEECCAAVRKAIDLVMKEAKQFDTNVTIIEVIKSRYSQGYKSALLQIEGKVERAFSYQWTGVMMWQCQSQLRPKHRRKNWFFSGQVFEFSEQLFTDDVRYQTCRASGAGGQHVNTTDSAVQATHVETGITVRVETERSQHANKRLAKALLFKKLEELKETDLSQ